MLSEAQLDELRDRNPVADVVARLGAPLKRGRYGACPICGGGPTAQRFEVKRNGLWVCAVCQDGGDVIRLVERACQLSFRQAVEWLGGAREIDPAEAERRARELAAKRAKAEADQARFREAERRRLYALWRQAPALAGTAGEAYLRGRGIEDLSDLALRFLPDAAYFDGEERDEAGRRRPRVIYRGPAMLAAFVAATGHFLGLHLTWVDPARPGKKAEIFCPEKGVALNPKKMRGHKQGGFLKIQRGGDPARVRVGEGIETTLSVRDARRDGGLYVAAGDLGNLAGKAAETLPHPSLKSDAGRPIRVGGPQPDFASEAVPIPPNCAELWLLKDGDSDAFTTENAMARAVARHARPGLTIYVQEPPSGLDFNDLLRAEYEP